MFLQLNGKTAIVTGAAQGIGESIVRRLTETGVVVAALDSNEVRLTSLVEKLKARGHGVFAFPVDVSDSKAVEEAVAVVERNIGAVDILVNAAGVLRMGLITSFAEEDWSKTFAVNTTGVFHMSRSVSRYMIPRRRGSIVTVASNAARVPRLSMAAYAASKAATVMFTKCLGLELAQYNIRCNIVSPGSTDTPMLHSMGSGKNVASIAIAGTPEAYKTGIPLNKVAMPEDIADAVLFLASERAGHITMADVCIDGGAVLGV